jgi:DNA-binding MarR family transcriptional regulator
MEKLSHELVALLTVVKEQGGTDCTGACHHRKPGEFHCHALSRILGLSSSGVKARIRDLVNMGLMERHRIEREGSTPMVRFVVTLEGEKALEQITTDLHGCSGVSLPDPADTSRE